MDKSTSNSNCSRYYFDTETTQRILFQCDVIIIEVLISAIRSHLVLHHNSLPQLLSLLLTTAITHASEYTSGLPQLAWGSKLNHPPTVKDEDLIEISNRTEAMRHHDKRAGSEAVAYAALDERVCRYIDS